MNKLCIVVLLLVAFVYVAYGSAKICATPGCKGLEDNPPAPDNAPPVDPNAPPGGISTLANDAMRGPMGDTEAGEAAAITRDFTEDADSEIEFATGTYALGKKCVTDCSFFGDSRFKEPYCSECIPKSKHYIVYTPKQPKCFNIPADIKAGLVSAEELNSIKQSCAAACKCVNVVFSKENAEYIQVLSDKIKAASQAIVQDMTRRFNNLAQVMAKASQNINLILTRSRWAQVGPNKQLATAVQAEISKQATQIRQLFEQINAQVNLKLAEILKTIDDSKEEGKAEQTVSVAIRDISRMYKPLTDAFGNFNKYLSSNQVTTVIGAASRFIQKTMGRMAGKPTKGKGKDRKFNGKGRKGGKGGNRGKGGKQGGKQGGKKGGKKGGNKGGNNGGKRNNNAGGHKTGGNKGANNGGRGVVAPRRR